MDYLFIGIVILLKPYNSATIETADNKCQNVFFPNCTCILEDSTPSVQCIVTDTTSVQINFDDDPDKKTADIRDYSLFTNETYQLPENMLKSSTSIKMTIMLSGLVSLDANVCNFQLAYLNVDHVKSLKTIDPKLLQECSGLLMLRVSQSKIEEVAINRNNNICKLQNVILVNSKIRSVSNELMRWCTQLNNVDLSGNAISHLPSQFFSTCSSLLTLSLSNNLISELGPQMFSRCDKLEDLDLSINSIRNLDNLFPQTKSNIRFLNFTFNRLQRLPDGVLSSLINLEEFDASHNNISFVAEDVFGECAKLRFVLLKYNNLSSFPIRAVENCAIIYNLDLSDNQIKSLTDHSLPPSLRSLDLSNNQLETLSSNLLKNSTNLEIILLSVNNLMNVPPNLLASRRLKNMDLSNNKLQSIPQSANESCLSSFDVSNNQIEYIDLGANPSIVYNISRNKISVITWGILPRDCFATILDASNNQLQELKQRWNMGLQKLLFLDLSFNFLRELSSRDLFLLTDLKHLNLSNNKLTYIEDGLFRSMHQLINLNLNDNPIHVYGANFFPVSLINAENVMCPDDPAQLIQSLNNIIDIFGKNYSCQRPINCKCQLIKSILSDFMCNYTPSVKVQCDSRDCPDKCFCVSVDESTFVDCDGANVSSIPAILPINTSVVYLESNQLLPGNVKFEQSWKQVVYVYMKNSLVGVGNNLIGHPFANLGETKLLDLSQNSISTMQAGVFDGLRQLNHLNLSGNQLTDLPSGLFTDVINLDILDLSNNKFTSLNNFMLEIPRLKHLIFKNNQITGKSSFVQLPRALISLDLTHNLISSTEFLFPATNPSKLPSNLTCVNLAYNQLKEINISAEDLGGNYLRLYLQNNAMEKINIITDEYEIEIAILQLFVLKNEILCDCQLKNLIESANSRNTSFDVFIDDAKCDKPIFLKDQNIVSLKPSDLLCTDSTDCVDGCNCYKNQSTDDILMDCSNEKNEILPLPNVAPPRIHSLYVRNLSWVHNLTDDSWNSLQEFYLVDREAFTADFHALKNISRIQRVELDEDCWCRVRNYVAFSLESVTGPCDQSLPSSHCIRDPTNNKSWSRVECTSSFTPQLTFAKIPICPVYENCGECFCYLDKSLSLVMNCSSKQLTQFPTLKPMDVNVLDMNNNFLTVLPDFSETWPQLVELYVKNNSIYAIDSTNLPATLELVDLENNSLRVPSGWLKEIMGTKGVVKTRLSLMGNPLECDCEMPNFSQWPLDRFSAVVIKANQTSCYKQNGERHLLIQTLQCKTSKTGLIVAGIMVLSILAIIAVLLALYFKYRRSIHVYLLAHDLCLCLLKEESFDEGKEYEFDAFLSYSSEDSETIVNVLLPGLEKYDFKVCVHERDWLGGEFISEQIVKSVNTSRRTIILLSEAFLKSPWATMEFKVALQQALEDRVNRIIVVVLGDTLPSKDQMEVDLRSFVTMNTYLFLNDSRFWDKLRFAMPHKKNTGKVPLRKLPMEFVEMMKRGKTPKKNQSSTKSSESTTTVCTEVSDMIETDVNDEIV